jgi:hypothetical protein
MTRSQRIVCPNGHSESFRVGPEAVTLVAISRRIDGEGRPLGAVDPNWIIADYTCETCGVTFHLKRPLGVLLGLKGAP